MVRALGFREHYPTHFCELGLAEFKLGNLDRAESLYQEAAALAREQGNRVRHAKALARLGEVAIARDAFGDAAGFLKRSLEIWQDLPPTVNYEVLEVFSIVGEYLFKRGEAVRAAEVLSLVIEHAATEKRDRDHALRHFEPLKEQLSPEELREAGVRARKLGVGEVVQYL